MSKFAFITATVLFAVGLTAAITLSGTGSDRPAVEIHLSIVQSNQRPFLLVVVTNITSEIRGSGIDYPSGLPPLHGFWSQGTKQTEFTTSNYPFPTAAWGWPKGGSFTKLLECPRGADGIFVELHFNRVMKTQLLAAWCNSHGMRTAEDVLDWFTRSARRNDPLFERATNSIRLHLSDTDFAGRH